MSGLTGTIPYPAVAGVARPRARVDHKNSEEAALVRRVQAHDEVWVRHIKTALEENRFRLIYEPVANLLGDGQKIYAVGLRSNRHPLAGWPHRHLCVMVQIHVWLRGIFRGPGTLYSGSAMKPPS